MQRFGLGEYIDSFTVSDHDFLRLGSSKCIHISSSVTIQYNCNFLFCFEAKFYMCFSVTASSYHSIHTASIFFEPFPWHEGAWKCSTSIFCISLSSSSKRDYNQRFPSFLGQLSLLVAQVEIAVFGLMKLMSCF